MVVRVQRAASEIAQQDLHEVKHKRQPQAKQKKLKDGRWKNNTERQNKFSGKDRQTNQGKRQRERRSSAKERKKKGSHGHIRTRWPTSVRQVRM
jgi:hypothetical protein